MIDKLLLTAIIIIGLQGISTAQKPLLSKEKLAGQITTLQTCCKRLIHECVTG